MAYSFTNSKGQTYFLHAKTTQRGNGKATTMRYFSKELRAADALDALPEGYTVVEMKTGLPVLKKAA